MPASVGRMLEVRVRPAVPEDADGIAACGAAMHYEVSAAEIEARLRGLPRDHAVFVAHDVHEVVGFVHVYVAHSLLVARRAELGGLAVVEDWHGRGVGTMLLARAETWAAEAGCAAMYVRSGEERAAAHRFYERAGYRLRKRQQVFTKLLGQTRVR